MKAVMIRLAGQNVDGRPNQRARAEETGRLNHAAPRATRPCLLDLAGLAGVATLTSRILGLVRDQILAILFGAGNDMDAFLVAFRIPNLAAISSPKAR
jgi:hypothetical protein